MKELVLNCTKHISQCIRCQANGFICEICRNKNDVIFAFELTRVYTCRGVLKLLYRTFLIKDIVMPYAESEVYNLYEYLLSYFF